MDNITKIIRDDAKSIISRVNLEPLRSRTVVVAGATGLIGTYVMAVLDSWGGCRLIYPVSTDYPKMGTAAYEFASNHAILKVDLSKQCDRHLLPPFDYGFYGAGYGQPAKFTARPLQTLAINTSGLRNTLGSMLTGGRLLYVSSSEIYSGHTKPPFCEHEVGTTNPQHPRG